MPVKRFPVLVQKKRHLIGRKNWPASVPRKSEKDMPNCSSQARFIRVILLVSLMNSDIIVSMISRKTSRLRLCLIKSGYSGVQYVGR